MIKNNLSTPIFTIIIIVATIILIYHTYQIWFYPEKYSNNLRNGVKDWWPFPNFYRKWYASRPFLWLFRIAYTLVLLILLSILVAILLANIGLFA